MNWISKLGGRKFIMTSAATTCAFIFPILATKIGVAVETQLAALAIIGAGPAYYNRMNVENKKAAEHGADDKE